MLHPTGDQLRKSEMKAMSTTPGTRKIYDRNPDDGETPTEPPRTTTKKIIVNHGGGLLRTLLIAGGSAVAAVIAVDFYRKVRGGGEDERDREQSPSVPALSPGMNQTFIPMPMPFPMPMMMGGYGGGMPSPPSPPPASRNGRSGRSEDEEEADLIRKFTKELRIKKAASAVRRQQVDAMAEEFMGDD